MEISQVKKLRYSKASLIMGIIGLISWMIPIIGVPLTIIGLVFGIKGYKGSKKVLSYAGVILCSIGLLASVTNAAIGTYRGATGELFTSSGGVVFCKNVDANLDAVDASTNFSTGDIYVRLKTASVFNTTKLKITIYKIEGIKESIFDSAEQVVNQDWAVIAVPITFEVPGKYKVLFTKVTDGKKLDEGIVIIK